VFFFSFCFVVVSCLPDKTSCRLLLFFVKKKKNIYSLEMFL